MKSFYPIKDKFLKKKLQQSGDVGEFQVNHGYGKLY